MKKNQCSSYCQSKPPVPSCRSGYGQRGIISFWKSLLNFRKSLMGTILYAIVLGILYHKGKSKCVKSEYYMNVIFIPILSLKYKLQIRLVRKHSSFPENIPRGKQKAWGWRIWNSLLWQCNLLCGQEQCRGCWVPWLQQGFWQSHS